MKRWLGILAIVVASAMLIVGAIMASGGNPGEAMMGLLKGSLGSPNAISGTLKEMTPLLMAGVAVYVALRAGLFNIGVEGQLTVGACACTAIVLRMPGVPGMLLGVAVGMIAGAAWALPAGLIRAYRGGHEVITTIMLNNIAGLLTLALTAGPLKDPLQEGTTTASIGAGSEIPKLFQNGPWTISPALIIGIVAAIGLAFWLRRRVSGYELQVVGANATAAEVAGIDSKRVIVKAMLLSGAIAGLAGGLQVLGFEHRFYANFSPGYGFDALGVALLAGNSALGLIPSALLFGILAKGGTAIQIFGVPKGITTVILGVLIIVAGAVRYRQYKAVPS